jgi:site-specific DNA-methyltransferase (adenine-specific)
MRKLCVAVAPDGGTVLDPFLGSGTTGCAAALQGLSFIGIEREAKFATIARKRIAHWASQPRAAGAAA